MRASPVGYRTTNTQRSALVQLCLRYLIQLDAAKNRACLPDDPCNPPRPRRQYADSGTHASPVAGGSSAFPELGATPRHLQRHSSLLGLVMLVIRRADALGNTASPPRRAVSSHPFATPPEPSV